MTFDELLQMARKLQGENALLREQLELRGTELQAKDRELQLKDQELRLIQHELKLAKAKLYARKRERFVGTPQPTLPFEEANETASIPDAPHASEAPDEEATEEITYTRRKPRRIERLPKNLPRKTTEIHPPAEELVCKDCHVPKSQIGNQKSEKLNYIPASFYIEETIRYKYACRQCGQNVSIAPLPPQAIDRGLPGSGLLAHVLVSKWGDHLPLHRQCEIFKRQEIDLSVSTLCEWAAGCAALLCAIVFEMHKRVLLSYAIQSDDTPITVLDKNAKGGSRRGYLWVYLGDEGEAVYDATRARSGEGPEKFLKGYQGYLQVDAYSGYDAIFRKGEVVEVGCFAHARRYFYEAKDVHPRESEDVLGMIRDLYEVEREAKERNLSFEVREKLRKEKTLPVLEKLKRWLDQHKDKILPKSPLGEAIHYALKQWIALTRYAHDGRLNIDNNPAERALRTVAVGRKNWLFAGSDAGAERAAIFYSLIYTCKRIGIDPFEYLKDVLDRVSIHPARLIWELTPRGWKEARERKS